MGKINVGRVFLGGIAAGAFAWVVMYAFVLLGLTRGLGEMLGAPELGMPSMERVITVALLEILLGGPLAVWFYAAIRPRFGPGPKTAIIAALWIWFVLGPYEQTVVTAIGFVKPFPLGPMALMDIVFLPFIIIAMLIGAWLYKEDVA